MCLQWCHLTRTLIDNDLPCIGCARYVQPVASLDQTCLSCTHRVDRAGQSSFCGLSKAPLPRQQMCCHWNVALEPHTVLVLDDSDVAPGVLEMWGVPNVAALFAGSASAPDYRRDAAGRVTVPLEDLALPLVYGVPAAHWEAMLAPDGDVWPSDTDTSEVPPAVSTALLTLLDALDLHQPVTGDPLAAYEHLYGVLEQHPVAELPEPWPHLIVEALELYAQQEGVLT